MITEKINNTDRKVKEGTDQIYDRVNEARREAKEFVQEVGEQAEEKFNRMRDTLGKSWSKAAHYGKEGWESVESFAEKHPIQVAAMTLALGILIGGALFSSSRKS